MHLLLQISLWTPAMSMQAPLAGPAGLLEMQNRRLHSDCTKLGCTFFGVLQTELCVF